MVAGSNSARSSRCWPPNPRCRRWWRWFAKTSRASAASSRTWCPRTGSADPGEQVSRWKDVHELLYRAGGEAFAGWNSSYDGQPIPLDEMRAWQDATIDRIRGLRPGRVLEIGVGSGLILSRLAPSCESYWGTDLSEEAIATLRVQVAGDPDLAGRVTLRAQPADQFGGLPTGFFDTVVINSVAQYFPDAAYLADVLRQAVGRLCARRSRVHRRRAAPGTAARVAVSDPGRPGDRTNRRAAVRTAVQRDLAWEGELLLDPDFFPALAGDLAEVSDVDVWVEARTGAQRTDALPLRRGPAAGAGDGVRRR